VKAGMVSKPEAYPWSCYQDYLSDIQQHHWLNRDLIVEKFQFKKDKGDFHEELLSQDAKEDIYQFFTKKNLPSLLGSKEFSNQIKRRFFASLIHPEKPASKQLALESKTVIELVCRRFGLTETEVLRQKRGVSNTPRDLAIYLVRKRSLCKLEEIAEIFRYSNYSGVSTALERITRQLQIDADLVKTVKKLEQQLNKKSQKKT
jgi:chromosomal replication initiation ATPase DnaA